MRKFLIGVLVGYLLMMTTPVLADSILQSIDVVLDSVQVQVDGEKLDANTILYNGSTYLPMRKVAEAVGKDVEWNGDTMTANIVDIAANIETKNIKEGDNMVNEFTIIEEKNGIPIIAEKSGETYYTMNYALELMQNFGNYSFSNKSGNISFILFEDGKTLIENIPYTLHNGLIFISKLYYEETILPLLI